MKVGFLGLGNMGAGIAANILKAGFDLTVWNRTQQKMEPLMAIGAHGAASPREAAENADIVLTSLMDDQSIMDNLRGDNGILAGMKPGATHVCVTTISPQFADELAEIHREHGTRFVAGPVLGRPDAAAAGELITFLAGDEEGMETAREVCKTYAKSTVPVGQKPSLAATLKLCLNYTAISIIELMSEAYVCAEKAGLNPDLLKEFYQSAFAHPVLKMYAAKVRNRTFDDGGFRMTAGLKDVRLMLNAAQNYGTEFEIGKIIEQKMLKAIELGMEDSDWSAIYEISRQQAGLNLGS